MVQGGFVVRPLAAHHDRQAFFCGTRSLDTYLHKQAGQDARRGVSSVFVASPKHALECVAGYYTLSGLSLEFDGFPPEFAKKLPKHPLPAALLGRLAVAQSFQGMELGKSLLLNALRRTQRVSGHIGLLALVVDAIDNKAATFYQKFGFLPMGKSGRWFFPLKHKI